MAAEETTKETLWDVRVLFINKKKKGLHTSDCNHLVAFFIYQHIRTFLHDYICGGLALFSIHLCLLTLTPDQAIPQTLTSIHVFILNSTVIPKYNYYNF